MKPRAPATIPTITAGRRTLRMALPQIRFGCLGVLGTFHRPPLFASHGKKKKFESWEEYSHRTVLSAVRVGPCQKYLKKDWLKSRGWRYGGAHAASPAAETLLGTCGVENICVRKSVRARGRGDARAASFPCVDLVQALLCCRCGLPCCAGRGGVLTLEDGAGKGCAQGHVVGAAKWPVSAQPNHRVSRAHAHAAGLPPPPASISGRTPTRDET